MDQYSVAIKHNINNKNDSHQGLCYVNKLDRGLLTNHDTLLSSGKNCLIVIQIVEVETGP